MTDRQLYRYYQNIVLMMQDQKYRGYELDLPVSDETTFLKKFSVNNFAIIRAKMPGVEGNNIACAVLLSQNAEKKKDYAKILKSILDDKPKRVIIIGPDDASTHIVNYISELKKENPNSYIEHVGHSKFTIDPFQHTLVPNHQIATVEQLKSANITPQDYIKLPRILASDIACVYIGAVPGQVVRIERLSNTAGIIVVYRYCIPG